jgi:enoyl-CoA hydratase/carnithine racemase
VDPQAVTLQRADGVLAASADLSSGLTAETMAQSLPVRSEDHAEGVQAAREVRSPSFTGR